MDTTIYSASSVPFEEISRKLDIVKRRQGERKRKNEPEYIDIVCAFDTETSTVELPEPDGTLRSHAFMYIWQFQLGPDYTIVGRTWEEYDCLIRGLRLMQLRAKERHKLTKLPVFVVWVHNLAFDWQFLRGAYHFDNEDCFFKDVRKPLYTRFDHVIEYRCSYMHSNMSLEKFCEYTGTKYRKLDGRLFDYSKIRFPWTPLSDYELEYCVNDVRALVEAITNQMDADGDTLKTIPYTSTGYVRRECKAAIQPIHYSISLMLPDMAVFNLLRRTFRGGNTHANRYHVGRIIENMTGKDICSSYPAQLLTKTFPMGPFHKLKDGPDLYKDVISLIAKGNAVIADYQFKGLKLKNSKDPFPYLPIAKCHCLRSLEDNGRIISADLCITALTEIDLQIVLDHYDFYDLRIYNAYTAIKGPLPKPFRDVVKKYYLEKTRLKGIENSAYMYNKMKNMLNSTYGMAVQKPIHDIVYYNDESEDVFLCYQPSEEDAEKDLLKAPFPYQWGVYCTALARQSLQEYIDLVPYDPETGISNAVYIDTDSVKYIGTVDDKNINNRLKRLSKKEINSAPDLNGKEHPIGVFEQDGFYKRFITWGAKRYAYEDKDGLHVTVSGVTGARHLLNDITPETDKAIYHNPDGSMKDEIPWEIDELGCLENFKPGMVWDKAGGVMAVYNDHDDFLYTDPDTGKQVHITSNVAIVPTTYTMTITEGYDDLINDILEYQRFCREKGYLRK